MEEESLIKQNGEVVQSDERKNLTIDKTDAANKKCLKQKLENAYQEERWNI